MIIGTTKELKNHEYRVGLTPDCAAVLVSHGHLCTNRNVAESLQLDYVPVTQVIA